jgi:hypothetical protein
MHGPSQLCGGHFLPLYTLQGEGQTLQFLKFWRTKADTGKLLQVAIAWLQLHTGVGVSLLNNMTTMIPLIATGWLPSLRTFIASIQGTIQLDHDYVPPIQWVHDKYDDNELGRGKINTVVKHEDINLRDIVMMMLFLLAFILP